MSKFNSNNLEFIIPLSVLVLTGGLIGGYMYNQTAKTNIAKTAYYNDVLELEEAKNAQQNNNKMMELEAETAGNIEMQPTDFKNKQFDKQLTKMENDMENPEDNNISPIATEESNESSIVTEETNQNNKNDESISGGGKNKSKSKKNKSKFKKTKSKSKKTKSKSKKTKSKSKKTKSN